MQLIGGKKILWMYTPIYELNGLRVVCKLFEYI